MTMVPIYNRGLAQGSVGDPNPNPNPKGSERFEGSESESDQIVRIRIRIRKDPNTILHTGRCANRKSLNKVDIIFFLLLYRMTR